MKCPYCKQEVTFIDAPHLNRCAATLAAKRVPKPTKQKPFYCEQTMIIHIPIPSKYSVRYDAAYNPKTGEWLEPGCGHPACRYCKNRPAKYPLKTRRVKRRAAK